MAFCVTGKAWRGGKSSCRFVLRSGKVQGMPERGHGCMAGPEGRELILV